MCEIRVVQRADLGSSRNDGAAETLLFRHSVQQFGNEKMGERMGARYDNVVGILWPVLSRVKDRVSFELARFEVSEDIQKETSLGLSRRILGGDTDWELSSSCGWRSVSVTCCLCSAQPRPSSSLICPLGLVNCAPSFLKLEVVCFPLMQSLSL